MPPFLNLTVCQRNLSRISYFFLPSLISQRQAIVIASRQSKMCRAWIILVSSFQQFKRYICIFYWLLKQEFGKRNTNAFPHATFFLKGNFFVFCSILNMASHNNAIWYTDLDGFLEHSPSGGSLYYKGPPLQMIILGFFCPPHTGDSMGKGRMYILFHSSNNSARAKTTQMSVSVSKESQNEVCYVFFYLNSLLREPAPFPTFSFAPTPRML